MDKIVLRNMRFYAYHGVYSHERINGHTFEVDLEMFLDLTEPARSDSLKHTVSYSEIYKLVETYVTKRRYNLVETLAVRIADAVLNDFSVIKALNVCIRKPKPPEEGHSSFEVHLSRTRE